MKPVELRWTQGRGLDMSFRFRTLTAALEFAGWTTWAGTADIEIRLHETKED